MEKGIIYFIKEMGVCLAVPKITVLVTDPVYFPY